MKPQPEPSTQEVLAGLVERVTFHNAENGFCVLRAKARGHRDLVTVVGHAATISAGEWITASGEWINDRAHGQQFKARFLKTSAPSSIDGIEKYLGAGMIRGIGPVYAKKMVKSFGDKVFDVIEAEPDRLREVTGIGAVRAKRITDAWAEQKIVREIMVFLHSNGVGTARAVRIFKTYGADAVQVMTENPYRLARDIRGIGFKTADAIAMKLGIEKTAMIRLRAGISYALTEAMDEGHCGLPTDQLIPLAEELLEAPKELILTALELERSEGAVIADKVGETACTFLAGLYRAEQAIAERLTRIVSGRLPWPWIDEEKAIPWIEKRSGLQLADSQRAAIRLALMAKALVITGGPGVGKTTIVNSILKILSAKGVRLLLCAPTGRAAKRMTEATGVEAKTIHRLLEVDPRSGGFKRNADNSLDCDLLVIDEASMVDVMLMQALLKGDARQRGAADRRRHRPAAIRRTWPGAGRHHRLLRCTCGTPDRGVPASRREPDHHQRPSHQSGRNARPQHACRRQRLLLPACRGSRARRSTHRGVGQDSHPKAFRLELHPRDPSSLSDESRRRWRAFAQHRIAGGVEPRRRTQGRTFRLDLCAGRQGHAD